MNIKSEDVRVPNVIIEDIHKVMNRINLQKYTITYFKLTVSLKIFHNYLQNELNKKIIPCKISAGIFF